MATQTENVSDGNQNEEFIQPQDEHETHADTTQNDESHENSKEFNFKQLREVNKQLENRIKSYEERLEGIEISSKNAHLANQNNNNDEDDELGEEDLVEGKHLKKALSKIEKILQQKELEAIPDKLKSKFSDFDEVVTKENLEKLKEIEPELFNTIRNGPDLFSKGVAAYKTLKSLGLSPEGSEIMKQKDQAQTNHKKPLSAQAIKGQGALHEANAFAQGLTPELKKQLQKEMAEAVKAR